MMNPSLSNFLRLSAVAILLSGCATTAPEPVSDAAAEAPAPVETPPPAQAPTGTAVEQAVPAAIKASVAQAVAAPKKNTGLTAELVYSVILAELAAQRGELALAFKHYIYAATTSRDARLALRATRIALYLKAHAEALEAAKLWVTLAPDSIEAHQVVGLLLLREGRVEQALEHFERQLEKSGGDRDTGVLKIAALLAKEQPGEPALKLITALNQPETAAGFHAISVVAAAAGNRAGSISAARNALALDGKRSRVRLLLGASLVAEGQPEEGIEQMRLAAESAPDDLLVGLTYAQALREADRYAEARRTYTALDSKHPGQAEVQLALGDLAMHARDLDVARGHYASLAENKQFGEFAIYQLGRIAMQRGELEAASGWFGRIKGTLALQARMQQARIRGRLGDVAGAREDYQAMWQGAEDEDRISLALSESTMLGEVDKAPAAIERLDTALQQFPGDEDLLYARALLGVQVDDLTILERDLQTILKTNPKHADALNALGYTLVDRTARLEEAEKYIREAYALEPNNAAVLDSMGWLHFRLGQPERALEYIERAHKLYPDGEIAAHLGEVLWTLGKREAAQQVLREALKQEPESEVLIEVMQRLK